ncbi:hypothetical protein L873DRAFT_1810829 [Choiromyces venosus 120613-1]|uniref:Uncharacterized protein n=1 Tax=Choiromyces venosus 120613-1 TaxID=1336337 RepID=A0A3N4JEV1_9PEZI|nr:hypothetical protein L873DRAFT_1810829 [Choiromyces venosus 120613-1]
MTWVNTQEPLGTGCYGVPQAHGPGADVAHAEIPEPTIYDLYAIKCAEQQKAMERAAFMTDKAWNYFEQMGPLEMASMADLSPTVFGSSTGANLETPEFGKPEGLPVSRTPPNHLRRPVDSDLTTPASPVFQKFTFPNPSEFNVHDLRNEHLFTPSPRAPGSSPPRFVLHIRRSMGSKNRGEIKTQPAAIAEPRRVGISAHLNLPSQAPTNPVWPTPGPETPPSSPWAYSVDTPSPCELVHKRQLKNRRAKLLAAQEQARIAEVNEEEELRGDFASVPRYLY